MTRCHVCSRPCVREVEPAFGELPAVLEADVHKVALRNSLYVSACFSCWFMWPDEHKLWPAVGYGRSGDAGRTLPDTVSLVDPLGEVA